MRPPSPAAPLPLHLERWSLELLGAAIPREGKATCDACVMCRPKGAVPELPVEYFDSRSKCCTFMPELANFLVGRLLADDHPDAARGRATVLDRIARGVAVTPLGLHRAADLQMLYDQGHGLFGRSQALRCPHYLEDLGACGVWRHREATCATWFCKHERGAVGRRFWKSLHELMRGVEQQLAVWCLLELGLESGALRALFPDAGERPRHQRLDTPTVDRVPDPALAREQWGEWLGRQAELYRRCAALVEDLPWSRVLEICEPRTRALARLTAEAFADLGSEGLPSALRVGALDQVGSTSTLVRISTYSTFDSLDLPHAVAHALRHFDGRPTQEALVAAEQEGMALDPALVRKLVDFEILVPAEGARPESL